MQQELFNIDKKPIIEVLKPVSSYNELSFLVNAMHLVKSNSIAYEYLLKRIKQYFDKITAGKTITPVKVNWNSDICIDDPYYDGVPVFDI